MERIHVSFTYHLGVDQCQTSLFFINKISYSLSALTKCLSFADSCVLFKSHFVCISERKLHVNRRLHLHVRAKWHHERNKNTILRFCKEKRKEHKLCKLQCRSLNNFLWNLCFMFNVIFIFLKTYVSYYENACMFL